MKKKRTKAEYLNDQLALKQEDIWKMELVRDFSRTKGTPQAELEVHAAEKRIAEIEVEITFMKGYVQTLKD